MKFVILLGVVSLFSDMTYEAARRINGPFLALLGAGAVVVATVAGWESSSATACASCQAT